MAKNRDEKRRRVTPDFMRQNAAMSGGGKNLLKPPKGITEWKPEKDGDYDIDFLPYEVTVDNHPDRVEKGMIWWKFPFTYFENVGVNNENIVSPASVGLPCPIMEYRNKLTQDWDKNEAAIKALSIKKRVLYAIKDPADKNGICLFEYAQFSLGDLLDEEIKRAKEEHVNFYDVKGGHTLRVRFSNTKFKSPTSSGTFLKATRIDFVARKDMDEAEVLAKVPALESCLNILPYDTIKAIFLGVGEDSPNAQDAGGGEESRPAPKATPLGSPKTKAGKATPPPVEEPEEDDEDGHEGPVFAVGDWVTGTADTDEPVAGEVITVSSDGTDIEVKDVNGDTYDCVASSLEKTTPPASAKKGANPPSKTAKAKSGAKRYENAAGLEFGVGDTVEDGEGATGVITAIDDANEDATCKPKKGAEFTLDWDDIKKVAGGAPAEEPEEDEDDAYIPAVGDEVEWDDSEGEILKLRDSDNKAKVKTAAGAVWVEIAKLSEK